MLNQNIFIFFNKELEWKAYSSVHRNFKVKYPGIIF